MKKTTIWILLIVNGLAYMSMQMIPYLHLAYYNAMQEALAITNTQIGLLASISGTMAIIGYIIGGMIADIFKPKLLLITSYLGQAALWLVYAGFPDFKIIVLLQILGAFFYIGLYWAATAKYVRSLGDKDQEARLYGIHMGCVGLGGTVFGLFGAYLVGTMGSQVGLRLLFFVFAAYLVIASVINYFLYKPKEVITEEEDKFKFRYVFDILRMPLFWLLCAGGFSLYLLCLSLSYFAPLLNSNYGVPLAIVSLIGTFRMYMARIICAPIGGSLIQKAGSIKTMQGALLVSLIAVVCIIVLPMNHSMLIGAVIILLVLTLAYNISVPTWFTPLTDINIPDKMRGTALGLYSAIIFSSDAFYYSICGSLLDSMNAETAYKLIYSNVAIWFVVGIIALYAAGKMINKRKAAMK